MSRCPDWNTLLAHRFEEDSDRQEPASWPEDLIHLDACEDCRIEALSIDPSLVFCLSMPEVEVSEDELMDMKQAVMTLRQGMELAAKDSINGAQRRRPRKVWQSAAAAAVLATSLGYGAASLLFDADANPTALTADLVADDTAALVDLAPDTTESQDFWPSEITTIAQNDPLDSQILQANWRDAPVIEDVNSPAARVSFLTAPEEELAVVMVIDPNLDV